jgi:hypothetical protein
MFGEIIGPINNLSSDVRALKDHIFDLKKAVHQLTAAINEQNALTRKAAHEGDRR